MENEKVEIELVEYVMNVPKEGKEVVDLLEKIIDKMMNGEDLSTYVDLMDEAYLAFNGIMDLGKEVKSQYKDELSGYLVHKLMGRLLR